MLTIGITAVGSGIGQPVLDSLRASSLETKIVGFEAQAWAKGVYECDAVYCLPRASEPDYGRTLLQRATEAGLDVLIPGSDPELVAIAELAPQLERIGCRAIVGAPDFVRTCRDKLALSEYLRGRGFAFVRTLALELAKEEAASLPYPVIVKPRAGSGSVDAQVVSSAAALRNVHLEGSWIVQPYLLPSAWYDASGRLEDRLNTMVRTGRPVQEQEVSIQVLVAADGQVLGRFASVNTFKAGVTMTADPVDDPEIWAAAHAFVEAMIPLGMRGPCNLQGRRTPDGLRFFEANPRFTGLSYSRALLGFREVEAAVQHFVLGYAPHQVRDTLVASTDRVALRQMTEIAVPRQRVEHPLGTRTV